MSDAGRGAHKRAQGEPRVIPNLVEGTVITQDVDRIPPVAAWRRIDAAYATPRRVEVVRRRNKAQIFRLVGVGIGGSDVIVKACLPETGAVERDIYAHVLPRLSVTQLHYYGFEPEPGQDFSWLFLEDARGIRFDPALVTHRVLSAEWLAQLHVSSSALLMPPAVPDRGPTHYRQHMNEARALIEANYEIPSFASSERRTIDRILALFDIAASRWGEIEALCSLVPNTLVHGDFADRNVRIRSQNGKDTLYAFDWEVSGWGPPTMDLAHADLPRYWTLVRDHWCDLDYETLRRLAEVGKLLRGGIAATNWTALHLTTEWPEKAIYDMRVYQERMTATLKAIGWAA